MKTETICGWRELWEAWPKNDTPLKSLSSIMDAARNEAYKAGFEAGRVKAAAYHEGRIAELMASAGGERENYFDIQAHKSNAALIRAIPTPEMPTEGEQGK